MANPVLQVTQSLMVLIGLVAASGCFPAKPSEDAGDSDSGADSGSDSESDSGSLDSGTDTGADSGTDSGADSGSDTGADSGSDSGADSGTDTSADSGSDTGADSGTDTGGDSGETDTGTAADCEVDAAGGAIYTDIQNAVDDADDGDTIRVCPGTYDFVEINRLEITVVGAGSDDTVIDGGAHPAMAVYDSTLTLSGFRLTGRSDSDTSTAGLYLENSTGTISDIVLRDISSTGAGILQRASDVSYENVVFADDALTELLLTTGGGSIVLKHSVFRDSEADSTSGTLQALYLSSDVTAEVSNNLFYNLSSDDHSTSMVQISSTSDAWVYNNTFYNLEGYCAVGIFGDGANFQNNIVEKGTRTVCLASESTGEVKYNDVVDYTSDYGFTLDATNLDTDPGFTDAAGGDFTLKAGFSELIDAGNPASGYNDPDGTRNDLGAYGGPDGDW